MSTAALATKELPRGAAARPIKKAESNITSWLGDLVTGAGSSPSHIIITGILGVVPGLGQAMDIRDLVMGIIAISRTPTAIAVWVDLVITLIGCIPAVGDALKVGFKLMKRHKRGDVFTGYWAWEAAAITYVLDIDDSTYRDMMFYPADLVDYARGVNAPKSFDNPNSEPELREKSGQICPLGGMWESLDIPPQRRKFEKGDVMQAADAAYGITVWRYLGTA